MKIKNILSTVVCLAVLILISSAAIFGQKTQIPTADKSKLAANQTSKDEKPVKTFKVSSKQTNVKPIEVKVFAGLVKGLEIVNTFWDDAKKVVTVEVENKNSVAASSKALLNLSIEQTYMGFETIEPQAPPSSPKPIIKVPDMSPPKVKQIVKTKTVYSKYTLIKELKPQTKTAIEFDFADFKSDVGGTEKIFENLADDKNRERQITLKIYQSETGN